VVWMVVEMVEQLGEWEEEWGNAKVCVRARE
jgi:hypothetical protein